MTGAGRHVIVLGGGITGLSAAFEAQRRGWAVTVVDADTRFGGKLRSSDFRGHRVDEGADAFLRRVPDAATLCAELGIDRLVSPAVASASVWVDRALHRLPAGLVLGAPVDFDALADSGILSPAGLERARADARRHGPGIDHDQAVGEVIRERYGDEVADRLVGPLLGGINAGDADRLSIDAGVPQLAAAARSDASLSRALGALPPPSGEPVFAAPVDTMGSIPERLVAELTAAGATLLPGTAAVELAPAGSGWRVELEPGGAVVADAVVVATQADVAATLLAASSPDAADLLGAVEYASVAMVTLGFDPGALRRPLDGSGFLVPRDAGLTLAAASWASSKWPHWTESGRAVLRVSAGHRDDPAPLELDDDDLIDALLRDIDLTMGLDAAPAAVRVSRWMRSLPQYDVGHLDRIAAVEAAVARDLPGVVVTGAAHRGLGVPACIAQGRGAMARLT